jgi:hypothetical protein
MTDTKKMDPRVIALIVIILLVGGAIAYFGMKPATGPAGDAAMPSGLSAADTEAMLAKMRELGPVPEEAPQTILIENAAAARAEQPFLENSEDGDVIFIFMEAKLALVYRPSTNAIIAAGPVNDGPPPPAGAAE